MKSAVNKSISLGTLLILIILASGVLKPVLDIVLDFFKHLTPYVIGGVVCYIVVRVASHYGRRY